MEFLKQNELEAHVVEKHNFWPLLKQVVPRDVAGYLNKRNYKDLYYIGLDLRENAIPIEKIEVLEKNGSENQQIKDLPKSSLKPVPTENNVKEGLVVQTSLEKGGLNNREKDFHLTLGVKKKRGRSTKKSESKTQKCEKETI